MGNANFAWVQHFLHHLAPAGVAGFVLVNGSMSSQQSGEGEIRKSLVEDDLIDCMVALPGQLFFSTQIPVCLWFLARDKKNGLGEKGKKMKSRTGKVLFIDARKLGTMVSRVQRQLTREDIAKIAGTYHAFRGDGTGKAAKYSDELGYCKVVTLGARMKACECTSNPSNAGARRGSAGQRREVFLGALMRGVLSGAFRARSAGA